MSRVAGPAGRGPSFAAVALVGDMALAVGVLYGAFSLRTHVALPGTLTLLPQGSVRFTFWNIVIVAAVQAFSLWVFGLYREHERFREPLPRLLAPALSIELLSLASIYFLAQPYSFPRSVLVVYIVCDAVLLSLWRVFLDRLFPQPRRRAIIVGTGPAATLIADTIRRHPWTGVELVGVLGEETETDGSHGLAILGPATALVAIVEAREIDEVILTPEAASWRDQIPERIPPGLARGPAGLALALRDDDRAPALPHRGRPAAARGAGAAARRRRGIRQARVRSRGRGRAAPRDGAGARRRRGAGRRHVSGRRVLPSDARGQGWASVRALEAAHDAAGEPRSRRAPFSPLRTIRA